MAAKLFDLGGRVAVVTGAAAGIGRAIAVGLAGHGADVLICDINAEGLSGTVQAIAGHDRRGHGMHCDVGNDEEITALFVELDRVFGRVDILVNNVGHNARSKPEELSRQDWEFVLGTGVTASLRCAQEAGRRMIAAGRGGSIINISSIAGATALGRGNLAHSANKGALHQLTRELAVEWAKYGIRVNAILPCQVLTEGFQDWLDSPGFDPALMARFLAGIPSGRLARAEDMVGPAVFLASDAAAMVTGTLLGVDGGNLALNAGGSHTW
ncbi:MAG: SDR family oxidoreductase [Chloroflexia bacterium]|nr:SDR family oxidoreductase [Chloroflexia bacterium]MDQ3411104.1 SDR family oxidoreductase [Chloroflexota bacterium]